MGENKIKAFISNISDNIKSINKDSINNLIKNQIYKDKVIDILNAISQISIRKLISSKINFTADEFKNRFSSILDDNNLSDNEKTIHLLENFLNDVFFNRAERKKNFSEILGNENLSHESISNFLEQLNNGEISSEDWAKLNSICGINNWSYGELGNNIEDRIKILETISYYSLQATLRTGIHTGLFIQNIYKFFPHLKEYIFNELKNNPDLSGGLALTELGSGSDLLKNLKVTYEELENLDFLIEGDKHWQGLTDEGKLWIILAREKSGKKVRLFFIDSRESEQNVKMIKEYKMRCLHSITYGVNRFKCVVPKRNMSILKEKDRFGLRTFGSLLYDSRLQFPAMLVGAMNRICDETEYKIKSRNISGGKMKLNEVVKNQFSEIKLRTSIVDLINKYLIYKKINLFEDNSHHEDLSILSKVISTEYILKSGDIAKRLQGGFSSRKDNIISNIIDDAYPFSVFEGVNEMLYSQFIPCFEKREKKEYLDNVDIDIKDLGLDSYIKGKIYSRAYLIGIINEMGLGNEYGNEIGFLKREINSFITKSSNFSPELLLKNISNTQYKNK